MLINDILVKAASFLKDLGWSRQKTKKNENNEKCLNS